MKRSRESQTASATPAPAAASVAAIARYRSASSRVYGDGTRVQRGISGSWQAATIAGTSRGASGRTAISPSESAGATIAGIGQVSRFLPPCAAVERRLARALFWGATANLAWTQVGYGLFLAALRRARGNPPVAPAGDPGSPVVSLIVAAYREQD